MNRRRLTRDRFSSRPSRGCLPGKLDRPLPRPVLVLFLLFLMTIGSAHADVIFFDAAVGLNRPIFLQILTKGALLPKGGQRALIQSDGIELGRVLTGADGYGYLKYVPTAPGTRQIHVWSGPDSDTGCLLVVKPGERTVVIGIEVALRRFPLFTSAADGSRPALEKLATSCRLVYLAGFLGILNARRFIERNRLPPAPVIRWKGADVFGELKRNGVDLYAVVGSEDVVSAAEGYAEKRFSFSAVDSAAAVAAWRDLPEKILK